MKRFPLEYLNFMWGRWHHNLKSQTPVDQWFTRGFKFSVDGAVDGFFNVLVVSTLQAQICQYFVDYTF